MKIPANMRLLRLSDSGLTVEEPAQDVRHRKVIDKAGDEVGTVDDLFIDDQKRKVRFLQVASGGFLGMGMDKVLIPVDAIARLEADAVHIDLSRDRIATAPRYDPSLTEDQHCADLYGYYGYGPYWGPGYIDPVFPHSGPNFGGRMSPH